MFRFRVLPPVVYTLMNLEVILASDNQIEAIDASGLKHVTRLATLDLRNNNIGQVPPVLGLCTQIKYVLVFDDLFFFYVAFEF